MEGLLGPVQHGLRGRDQPPRGRARTAAVLGLIESHQRGQLRLLQVRVLRTWPDSERLVNRKLALRDVNQMRDWKVALKEYVDAAYSNYL